MPLPPIDYTAIGGRIRIARNNAKLTQAQLAEACDLSTSHIGNIERGHSVLSVEVLYNLATLLNVNIDFLLRGDFPEDDGTLDAQAEILQTKYRNKVKDFIAGVKFLADKLDEM